MQRSHNRGVRRLGLKLIADYARKDCVWVSVGSGNAALETHLQSEIKGLHILCVDPAPGDWLGPAAKADFETVEELLASGTLGEKKNRKEVALILNWPSPNGNTVESAYDLRAVRDLKPAHLLTITETTTGGAGSRLYNTWLHGRCGLRFENHSHPTGDDGKDFVAQTPAMHVVAKTRAKEKSAVAGVLYLTAAWLSKSSAVPKRQEFPERIDWDACEDYAKGDACVLM